jgi:hypothetical protein
MFLFVIAFSKASTSSSPLVCATLLQADMTNTSSGIRILFVIINEIMGVKLAIPLRSCLLSGIHQQNSAEDFLCKV